MNKEHLYSLLPNPDEVGSAEYRTLHNLLVDAVNEWSEDDSHDVFGFAMSVLSELSHWTSTIIDRLALDVYGDQSK
jgi:hypothetical protein